jgi:hypothetical protein
VISFLRHKAFSNQALDDCFVRLFFLARAVKLAAGDEGCFEENFEDVVFVLGHGEKRA